MFEIKNINNSFFKIFLSERKIPLPVAERPPGLRQALRAREASWRLPGDRVEQRGLGYALSGDVRARLRLRPGRGAPGVRRRLGGPAQAVGQRPGLGHQ